MKIHKEIEIDFDEIKTADLFEAIRENLDAVGVLYKPEYREKIKPFVQQMTEKLKEIENFLLDPTELIK